ncbi:transcriptional repressor [Francisellaceae bacterium]|nr:transcriptional repressor [Francisellaceae bacterium]
MQFEEYILTLDITVTDLRKDILSALWYSNKPLKAYSILNTLKQIRPTAKPPTVYRVLDYLVKEDVVHRIEATQSYVLCTDHTCHETSKQILMICNQCEGIQEISDIDTQNALESISKTNNFEISSSVIELYGICKLCLQS